MVFTRHPLGDPAADAARFLRRLAFIILMVVAPAAELVSHGLLYILFPVGAVVLVIAGLLAGGEAAWRRAIAAFRSPIGAAVLFLALWSALSLIWTPFPGEAAQRLGRTLLTAGLAMAAIMVLPERTKISNIYLLPIGVAVTAFVALPLVLLGPDWFRAGPYPDYVLAQRCILTVALLLWPALGGLALREHFVSAIALAVLVAAAALAAFVQVALAALMVAALAYAAAIGNPRRTGLFMAVIFAVLFLAAPLIAALLYPLFLWMHLPLSAPIAIFSGLVVHQWPRFITGHGLDMVEQAIATGLLPPEVPRSIIFTLWYELGILGVSGFVFLLSAVLLGVARLPQHAGPAFLAVIAAGIAVALLGAETTQLWWITVNAIAALATANLVKAHPRAKRPPAPPPEEETGFPEARSGVLDFGAGQEPDF